MGINKTLGRLLPRVRDFRQSRRGYRYHFGRSPSLFFPKTFNEKLQRRKIADHDPRLVLCADKVLVKDFVDSRLGFGWITPTLWHGAQLPQKRERNWPLPFLIKANHGCAMNIFVRSVAELDWTTIEAEAAKWLSTDFSNLGGEWCYRPIKRQLLVEPFIGPMHELPNDFKFLVFDGRTEFIQVNTDRSRSLNVTMFDREWNRLPVKLLPHEIKPNEITPPSSLKEMIAAAECLGRDMLFVRVDFYEIEGRPRFGEMTFYPNSGFKAFDPPEFDRILGDLWH
jgi:hypothetical protein